MHIRLLIIAGIFLAAACGSDKEKRDSKGKEIQDQTTEWLEYRFEKSSASRNRDSFAYYGDQLLKYYKKNNKQKAWSDMHLRMYDSLYRRDNPSEADKYLLQLIDNFNRDIADSSYKSNLLIALYLLGIDLFQSSKYFNSLKYFEKYLVLSGEMKWNKPEMNAFVIFSIADIYVRIGDNNKALHYFTKAVKQYRSINDYERVAVSTINLANCLNNSSQFDSAIAVTASMDAVTNLSKERKASLGMVKAEAFLGLDKPAETEKIIAAISKLLDTADHLRQYQVRQVSSELYLAKGEIKKAIAAIRVSIANALLHFGTFRVREIGKLYNSMANCYKNLQNRDSAIYFIRHALYTVTNVDTGNIFSLPLKQELYAENTIMETLDAQAEWMTNEYAQKEKLQYWQCAIDCYDLAFEVERKLLLNFSYDESKIRMLKDSRQRSEKAIALCYKLYQETKEDQWIEKAFHFAERNKAFIVLESARRNLAISQVVQHDTLFQKVQQLQTAYAYAEKSLVEARNSNDTAQLKQLEESKVKADGQLQLAQTSLYRNNNSYREWMEQEDSISLSMCKNLLPDNQTALLEYFVGDTASYAIMVINKEPYRFISIANSHMSGIDSFQFFFSNKNEILKNPGDYQQKAKAVYTNWLKPCLEKFTGNKLLIIPDGRLALVPFDALVSDITADNNLQAWAYLVKKYQVDMGYSVLTLLKQKSIQQNNTGAVAFAPGFTGRERNLTSLPFTFEEIDNIRNIKGKTSLFKQGNATLTRFRNLAPGLALIHIASHAQSDSANGIAAIEFADSTLLLNELYAMRLNAGLVILSACETGIGKIEKGEGAMSLARGFYYAGAKNIITSLWNINDQSTAMLFKDFYQHIGNNNFSAALHQSKMDYLSAELTNDKYSPYYWAGFIYIGSTDTGNAKQNDRWIWLTAIAIFLLSLIIWSKRRNKKGPAVMPGPGKLI